MISLRDIDLLGLQSSLKIRKDQDGTSQVWDPLRKRYIRSTPEEIVRQLWLLYLLEEKKLNGRLIAIERAFKVDDFVRRFDLVVFDKNTKPVLLAEFKAPAIPITQSTFDQIARYNMKLEVPYSLISNGSVHYCFQINDTERRFNWLDRLPL